MAAVIPYAFCALAGAIILRNRGTGKSQKRQSPFKFIEIVAFVFAIWTIYGCGPQAVLYGLLLLLLGIPVYVGMRSRVSAPPTAINKVVPQATGLGHLEVS
jgi:arginine:agmatine antiporter